VHVLAALSRDQTIAAPVKIEQASMVELFGPAPQIERLETDPSDDAAPAESDAPTDGRADSDTGSEPGPTP
jgi:hypothetical protein